MALDDSDSHDWAAQLTARLDAIVGVLRRYSVEPSRSIVRGLLIGTVGIVVGLAILTVAIVGLFRLFDTDVFRGRVWATYVLFGGIFLVVGAFLLTSSARRGRERRE